MDEGKVYKEKGMVIGMNKKRVEKSFFGKNLFMMVSVLALFFVGYVVAGNVIFQEGNLDVEENVTADYFFGDGSQLTGVSGSGYWNRTGTLLTTANADDDIGIDYQAEIQFEDSDGNYNYTLGTELVGQRDPLIFRYDGLAIFELNAQGSRIQSYVNMWVFDLDSDPNVLVGDSGTGGQQGGFKWDSSDDSFGAGHGAINLQQIRFNNDSTVDWQETTKIDYGATSISQRGDNVKRYWGETDDASIYYDGTNMVFNTSENEYGLAWFSSNVSAEGFMTRTQVYDKSQGSALDKIKDAGDLKDGDEIDHGEFYGYVEYEVTDFSRPETEITDEEVCEPDDDGGEVCEVVEVSKIVYPHKKTEEGVNIVAEIELLRQAIYELKLENEELRGLIE